MIKTFKSHFLGSGVCRSITLLGVAVPSCHFATLPLLLWKNYIFYSIIRTKPGIKVVERKKNSLHRNAYNDFHRKIFPRISKSLWISKSQSKKKKKFLFIFTFPVFFSLLFSSTGSVTTFEMSSFRFLK